MTDFYKILNLKFGASEAEIKTQFRSLALQHHPDKNNGSKQAELQFKEILNAYEILSDNNRRTVYDKQYLQHYQSRKTVDVKDYTVPPFKGKSPRQASNLNFMQVLFFAALLYVIYLLWLQGTSSNSINENTQMNESKRPNSGELFTE